MIFFSSFENPTYDYICKGGKKMRLGKISCDMVKHYK